MSSWFTLDASDGSICIVHEKNILQAGQGIAKNDKVGFYYQGKKYTGIVLDKNGKLPIPILQLSRVVLLSLRRGEYWNVHFLKFAED